MELSQMNVPLRPILGEREVVVAWLAENDLLPIKNERGRYTLRNQPGGTSVGFGVKLLVVDNLGISSDADLREIQEEVTSHIQWDGDVSVPDH